LSVEGVDRILVASKNDHFNCVNSDSYSWLLDIELRFSDDERCPFLVSEVLDVIDISLVELVSFLQVED
jgi:hypothetical protein